MSTSPKHGLLENECSPSGGSAGPTLSVALGHGAASPGKDMAFQAALDANIAELLQGYSSSNLIRFS